jgi:L-alanine-DL-glutamate epimerase-like enolase superfamily enzyme
MSSSSDCHTFDISHFIGLVRIHADEGLYGIGETPAWRRMGSSEVLFNLAGVIKEIFVPRMIGRSPLDIASIMYELNCSVYNSLYAQAAVGDALYDLAGKIFLVPLYELLGGKFRDSIKVGIALHPMGWTDVLE